MLNEADIICSTRLFWRKFIEGLAPDAWKRLLIDSRCQAVCNCRAQAATLLDRVYNIVTGISISIDSRYGLLDVDPPPSLESS